MDLLSKDIKKLSIQADLLGAFEICAIAAATDLLPAPANTALGKMLAKILNSPEDPAWWKILSYYTISNNQIALAWEDYSSLDDADRKVFENNLRDLLEIVIAELSAILFTADSAPVTNANLKTVRFNEGTADLQKAAYDAWRLLPANAGFTPLREYQLTGNDGTVILMVSYYE